jgi:hypothetical protein
LFQLLKLTYDEVPSDAVCKFNLRRYSKVFQPNQFDGAYAIEAACHASVTADLYKQAGPCSAQLIPCSAQLEPVSSLASPVSPLRPPEIS